MGNFLVELFDLLILCIIAFYFFDGLFILGKNIYALLFNLDSIGLGGDYMLPNKGALTNTTTTTIVHSNDGWAQGIKSILIYGTGALQLQLLRGGGTPLQRGFIIAGTVAADVASTALKMLLTILNMLKNT